MKVLGFPMPALRFGANPELSPRGFRPPDTPCGVEEREAPRPLLTRSATQTTALPGGRPTAPPGDGRASAGSVAATGSSPPLWAARPPVPVSKPLCNLGSGHLSVCLSALTPLSMSTCPQTPGALGPADSHVLCPAGRTPGGRVSREDSRMPGAAQPRLGWGPTHHRPLLGGLHTGRTWKRGHGTVTLGVHTSLIVYMLSRAFWGPWRARLGSAQSASTGARGLSH